MRYLSLFLGGMINNYADRNQVIDIFLLQTLRLENEVLIDWRSSHLYQICSQFFFNLPSIC